ncbi:MAG: RNA polymerase sigma factor [Candidatus Dormibacteraeota bacterium]|nr:RNA polymerase sigma factor [Candidatus Dormibacteraeota bacterium]
MSQAADALALYVRDEAGLLVASLTRQLGDFDLAEEAVQDAIVEALRHWPVSGVPAQPGAWLRVTARRRATDRLRREARRRDRSHLLEAIEQAAPDPGPGVVDDRLVLVFMCCHPALPRESQVALTLRCLLGLTTTQLASAFLTSEATMAKRIVRAKRRIVEAAVPFAVPSGGEVKERLAEVLTSVYVMFNEGYLSAGPSDPQRAGLADDAEWLAGLLERLMPDEPEVVGLLALIRLHQARRRARFDAAGNLVLLKDQDRSLWDEAAINRALTLLTAALRRGQLGPYQAQAAIAGCHARSRRWEDTDWGLIVRLYDQLLALGDSPVAALNRAVAVQYLDGAEAGMAALDPLAARLETYHLFHAARAQMLRELGRFAEASDEDRRASVLTSNPAELSLLKQRIEAAAG